jgi:hypothetical protein
MARPAIHERAMTAAERRRRHRDKLQQQKDAAADLFAMTNLYPGRTGLPTTIWVSPRDHARHAARIKVNMAHRPRMTLDKVAIVRLQPVPRVIAGTLSADDRVALFQRIGMNESALLDHWNGLIDGGDLIERLRPLAEHQRNPREQR